MENSCPCGEKEGLLNYHHTKRTGNGGKRKKMGTYQSLSRFILTRGLVLCALLLAGTAALLLRAGQGGAGSLRLYDCAEVFQFAATVSFGCDTVGSLLMEDLLRYYGEKD